MLLWSDRQIQLLQLYHVLKLTSCKFFFQTPDNFEADFNEIMKREEEESGVHLSCSGGKTSSRVRTSLEEKYAKMSKTTSAPTANGSEEQPSVMEQEQSSSIVECVVVCDMKYLFLLYFTCI